MGTNNETTRRAVVAGSVCVLAGCVGARGENLRGAPGDDQDRWWGVLSEEDEPSFTNPEHHDPTDSERASHVHPPFEGLFINSGTAIDTFDDVDVWSSGTGHITADRETRFTPDQSLSYEGTSGSIIREYADEPLDLRDADLSIAAYFRHSTDSDHSFYLIARAPDPENRIIWRGHYAPNTGWQRYDLTPLRTEGDPDHSQIRQVELQGTHPSEDETTFNVDDLRQHPKPEKGKLIFLLYGGRSIHYDGYRRILSEHEFPAVEAVHKDQIWKDHSGRLSEWQLRVLQDAGWDICATTTDSPWELSEEQLHSQLSEMHEWFADKRLEQGTNVFMYPYGLYTDRHLDVLGHHFDLAFVGRGRCTNYALTSPLTLPKFDVQHGIEETKAVIDRAAAHRSVGVLRFRDSYTRSEFAEIVEYVAKRDQDLEVITGSELAEAAWSHRDLSD